MAKSISGKKFVTNVIVSIAVQVISLAVNFVLYLIVPKFIDEYQYAYWQTFILYVSYVGILHFGLLDGLVLRYSQYDYEELDKARLRSQFKILLIFTGTLTVLSSIVSLAAFKDTTQIIVVLVSLGIVTKNLVTYSSYTFQITNRIRKYAILIIVQRLAYGLTVLFLLLFGVKDFYWYCIADLLGDAVCLILAAFLNRGLYLGKSIKFSEALKELKCNISAGILLMMANWSAMFMFGSAKMIVQWRWDEILFGKVSFAFSVSNLFLTFITAVSVVLFPSLKRIDEEKLPEMYRQIRSVLSPILFIAMLLYFPGCWILQKWLPNYAGSLGYLGIILPTIVYSSKVNLLTNNYLKVYRKERVMLLINAISVAVGFISFLICAYWASNLTALLICIVVVVMLNSISSEIMVLRVIKKRIVKDFIFEGMMTVGFILAASLCSLTIGCIIYTSLILAYCAVNFKTLKSLVQRLLHKRRKEET